MGPGIVLATPNILEVHRLPPGPNLTLAADGRALQLKSGVTRQLSEKELCHAV